MRITKALEGHLDGLKKDRLGLFNKEAKASPCQRELYAYLDFVVCLFLN